ncbi:uncharacterized protein L969DRAFT_59238 [Mixia osmundae IAM 14324]|uniref:Uncharacterized protein n=1 Tax=Mixia osmundae (strain CBS 9802 / IAM 14324 / JCM 22182 / KY 12970) TaxID=764103 RepID=G7E680_MIXOS|nr:uncharacterized protein L969DRAFT_59238 [Mixia osmundae IAM 14324]KEI40506.1 hypothetical protein L969DRAFT_59238 [Mixia osmundae IAM 14324]GAA98340.1 hypothetical protein E5Q_05025 [Mixia osmundae IAM 14324]
MSIALRRVSTRPLISWIINILRTVSSFAMIIYKRSARQRSNFYGEGLSSASLFRSIDRGLLVDCVRSVDVYRTVLAVCGDYSALDVRQQQISIYTSTLVPEPSHSFNYYPHTSHLRPQQQSSKAHAKMITPIASTSGSILRASRLAATALLLLGLAQTTLASVTYKNAALSLGMTSKSVVLPKDRYIFTNVGTGQTLQYDQSGQDIYPGRGRGDPMTITPHGHGTQWSKISPTNSNNKCLSAQWDYKFDGGADWAAVMYTCYVDPTTNRGFEHAKQWWLLVPVGKAKATKSRGKRSLSALEEEEATADLEKRGYSGVYYIVPTDHIHDMQTRALTSCSVKTAGGATSTCLRNFSASAKTQQWRITPA